ncbi:MAG: hypothetical protein KC933_35635 [Myxococcales bacterium]|nr:hypothetical protein [Myxococcales bacterium]
MKLLGSLMAVATLVSGCVSTQRNANPTVSYTPLATQPLDRFSYRLGQSGASRSQPRQLVLQVERGQDCLERVQETRVYSVQRKVEYPSLLMWMLGLGAAGFGAGYGLSRAFQEDADMDGSPDASFLGDGLLMGGTTAAAFVLLATLLPTGDRYSTTSETEEGEVSERRKPACKGYAPAAEAPLAVTLASQQVLDAVADPQGRLTLEVDLSTWRAAAGGEAIAGVRFPDGGDARLDTTPALREHAQMVVERAKRQQKPPLLSVFASFEDAEGNGNDVLDAGEKAQVVLRVENRGGGTAYAVVAQHEATGPAATHITLPARTPVGEIPPGESKVVRVPVEAQDTLPSGTGQVVVGLEEEMGFGTRSPVELRIPTEKFKGPELRVAAYEIFDGVSAWAQGDGRRTVTPGEQIELRVQVTNTGEGAAEGVALAGASGTSGVSFLRDKVELGRLLPGQTKKAVLVFRVLPRVKESELVAQLQLSEARSRFRRSEAVRLPMEQPVAARTVIDVSAQGQQGGARCGAPEGWVIAVMGMRDMRGEGAAEAKELESLTRQLYLLATRRGLTTVDRGVQARELERIVKDAQKESYRECYDESCQIELGKALAASHLLVSELDSFGEECTLGWQILDLSQEATVCAWRARGRCDSRSLLDMTESVAAQLPGR